MNGEAFFQLSLLLEAPVSRLPGLGQLPGLHFYFLAVTRAENHSNKTTENGPDDKFKNGHNDL